MNQRSKNRRRSNRSGATAVEFALTAPLLIFLLFASVEFGRANMVRHAMDIAAYEGARRGIVPGATSANARTVARAELAIVSARGATITVVPATITDDTSDVTVTISIPMNRNGWIAATFLRNATISRSCTLAREKY